MVYDLKNKTKLCMGQISMEKAVSLSIENNLGQYKNEDVYKKIRFSQKACIYIYK